jgi:hypothetical protein
MMPNRPHKRWNGLQEQTWTNKENIPPKIRTKINKLGRRNMVPTLIQWGRWTSETLEEIMNIMEEIKPFWGK